jgi:hypothetical protein
VEAGVKAMMDNVKKWSDQAKDGGVEVAYNLMNSTAQAIGTYSYLVQDALTLACGDGTGAVEEEWEINSPSKVFARFGKFAMLGLAEGITENADQVSDATMNSMRTVVGHIADIINGEVVVDPTIRPVVDLSGVQEGTAAISSMFGGRAYSLSRGINIQNRSDSMRDMLAQMSAMNTPASAIAGSPVNIYVYAAEGQSEEEVANAVERKFMHSINKQEAIWT